MTDLDSRTAPRAQRTPRNSAAEVRAARLTVARDVAARWERGDVRAVGDLALLLDALGLLPDEDEREVAS